MKRIEWNRIVPLGMDGERLRLRLNLLVLLGGVLSMRFLFRYADGVRQLYYRLGNERILIPGARIPSFESLLQGSFTPMAVIAVGMVPMAAVLYLYHYQGGRSIYTMRRLPSRWELWRRCVTAPAVMVLRCAAAALVLTGLYYLVWRFLTPAVCLPL